LPSKRELLPNATNLPERLGRDYVEIAAMPNPWQTPGKLVYFRLNARPIAQSLRDSTRALVQCDPVGLGRDGLRTAN